MRFSALQATISRELYRNRTGDGYYAAQAHRNCPVKPYLPGLLGCREIFFSMVFSGAAYDGGFTGGDAVAVVGAGGSV